MKLPATFILHPILIAIFPILSLYNYNKDLLKIDYLWRPIFIASVLAAAVFLLSKKLLKNQNKAAITGSLFIIMFFSYGHLLDSAMPNIRLESLSAYYVYYFIFLFVWLILFLFITLMIADSRKKFDKLNSYLNIVSIILVIMPLAGILAYWHNAKDAQITREKMINLQSVQSEDLPDIYYIILDGYARSDILKKIYNFDNNNFINYLKNRGFYVASSSSANYAQTYLSVSSSLNLNYIDSLIAVDKKSDDRQTLRNLIKDSETYYFLKNKGYKFATLPSIWTGTYKNLNSDIFLGNKNVGLNEFENILINTTPIKIFFDKNISSNLRQKVIYNFEHMADITEIESPTFIYSHFLSPHSPFIFDKNGKPIETQNNVAGLDGDHYFKINPDKEEYKRQYAGQLEFISKKAGEMIEQILSKSKKPPIIILQSDHGPGLGTYWENPGQTDMIERFSILNAIYLPSDQKKILYPDITPVNSFRIIFNSVFNAKFNLLEDKSFFSTWSQPYNFIDVTQKLRTTKR